MKNEKNDRASDRSGPLNVFLQVNTSGEDEKSGLPPLASSWSPSDSSLIEVAKYIITKLPHLHLQGLMTIGSLAQSLASSASENKDFETLKSTRDVLQKELEPFQKELDEQGQRKWTWGENESGKLLLSMGMSSDFEAALKAGSDVVRVGTGIFGERHKKGDAN